MIKRIIVVCMIVVIVVSYLFKLYVEEVFIVFLVEQFVLFDVDVGNFVVIVGERGYIFIFEDGKLFK